MEQQTKDNTIVSKTSPSKKLKQHHSTTDRPGLNDNYQRVVTKSDSSNSLDVNINTLVIKLTRQSSGLYNKV